MIKLTYEDDTGIFGFKDKNAWTQEDATHMVQEMWKQIFDLPANFVLESKVVLPETKHDPHAADDGM
jgi:hypothetical protein